MANCEDMLLFSGTRVKFAAVNTNIKRQSTSMEEIYGFIQLLLFGNMDGVQTAIAPVVAAAAISAATSIMNGIMGSRSAQKQKEEQLKALREQQAENKAWYNRRYNEDATQTASAQLMMRRTNDAIKKRTQAALGRKNVTGGTDASMAATQQANAEAVGNALGDIVANAETRKDNIEQQYRERQGQLASQISGVNSDYEATKRQNLANAATGAGKAMASVWTANAGTDDDGAAATRGTTTPKVTTPTADGIKAEAIDNTDLWQQRKTGYEWGNGDYA